jgi:Ca-activated chloride channel family protein
MRKIILVLFVTLLGSTLSISPTRADGMIIPETLSPDYLVVRYHQVTVNIKDGHAVTRVEQEFYNPHPAPVGGRYTFPVPPDAILSNFKATVDGQPQAVTRQNQAQTNAVLFDTIARRRDPSLLQYADWETLAFDINLPAGGSRQMILEYEEVLAPSGGLYHYHYVLSTERYTAQPLDEVSITVNLESSAGLGSLYSSSHTVTTERLEAGRARVTWKAENVQPTEDFDLFFSPADGGFGGGLLTGQRDGQNHFLFTFAPDTEAFQENILPKDIIFVIDCSGSMGGEKIEQARNALHFTLNQLNPNDRFSIIGFDDRLAILSPSLQTVDRQTLANARRFVDSLSADGSTNLEAALQTGLAILTQSESRPGASKMVIFLTDGLPTAGITDTGLIADLVAGSNRRVEARLHVFGVGYDVNTHLLDRLAEENGGFVTYVQPGENLEVVLSDFYGRIANPVLTDLEISFEGLEVSHLYPQQLPDMFQGSSLLLTGRYRPTDSEVTVRVRGKTGETEQAYTYQFKIDQAGNHDFVPRLWATRRVGQLLDQVRVEGESAALIEEIRGLGLSYGLVTPYTTFVIQAQTDGAASAENMSLYSNPSDLRQGSGKTTIQARVQNQMYQQTDQAGLAAGANILNKNQRSIAQVSNQNIDLALLREQQTVEGPLTPRWIEENIKIDRQVTFGSEAYFALAGDPEARPYLQSGSNVVFAYQGEIIAVRDSENPPEAQTNIQYQNAQPRDDSLISDVFYFFQQLFRTQKTH